MSFRVILQYRLEWDDYALVLGNGDVYYRFVPEKRERHGIVPEGNILRLAKHEAKELMLAFSLEARKHGIRPPLESEDTEAMRRHLEDMRALVFKTGKPDEQPPS